LLKPSGLTFDDFRQVGSQGRGRIPRSHWGRFPTPSARWSCTPSKLKDWASTPCRSTTSRPSRRSPSPSWRETSLWCSPMPRSPLRALGGRKIPSLREHHPQPLVTINAETAERHGIAAGDWVQVATKRGRITQKAVLSDEIDPRVSSWSTAGTSPRGGRPARLGGGEPERAHEQRSALRSGTSAR